MKLSDEHALLSREKRTSPHTARTGRARCADCGQLIAAGTLRVEQKVIFRSLRDTDPHDRYDHPDIKKVFVHADPAICAAHRVLKIEG